MVAPRTNLTSEMQNWPGGLHKSPERLDSQTALETWALQSLFVVHKLANGQVDRESAITRLLRDRDDYIANTKGVS